MVLVLLGSLVCRVPQVTVGSPNMTGWGDTHRAGYGYYEIRMKANTANATSGFYLYGSDPAGTGWETELDVNDGCAHLSNPPVVSAPTVADYAAQQGGVWG